MVGIGSDRSGSLGYSFLPPELGDKITDYSNQASFKSLAKFRNAISTLAFAQDDEARGDQHAYLSWRELIHTSYFEVPEFRKLLAYAIGEADGFAMCEAFGADPDFERAKKWYATLGLQPVQA